MFSNSPLWVWIGFFFNGVTVLFSMEFSQEREIVHEFCNANFSNNFKYTFFIDKHELVVLKCGQMLSIKTLSDMGKLVCYDLCFLHSYHLK